MKNIHFLKTRTIVGVIVLCEIIQLGFIETNLNAQEYVLRNNEHEEHSNCEGHNHAEHAEKKELVKTVNAKDEHSNCEGHNHAKIAEKEELDNHKGHNHDSHKGCSGDDGSFKLSKAQEEEGGLTISKISGGSLYNEIVIPGEIVLNSDKVVHLVPKVSGIVTSVKRKLGDQVSKGDVVAILESTEFGEAKSEYFEVFNEVGCCEIDLQRAKTIELGTKKLLADLAKLLSLEKLRKKKYGDIGEYRSRLFSSYADFILTKNNFERKQKLYKDKIVSKNDFLEAQRDWDKAQSKFYADCDNSTFEIKQSLLEKERLKRVAVVTLKTAKRKLTNLGVSTKEIANLQAIEQKTKCECDNPNCKTCKDNNNKTEIHNNDKSFSLITLKAPNSGTMIQRHIVEGEMVSNENNIFTIANLKTVWCNLNISIKQLDDIHKGDKILIQASNNKEITGIVNFISPIINPKSRMATVRLLIDNTSGMWRPGSFVTGHIKTTTNKLSLVVPKNAVQNIDGENVIFVSNNGNFKPVPVVLGQSDKNNVEIISGVKPGTSYVNKGAFELKAQIITSNMDPHAGHGH